MGPPHWQGTNQPQQNQSHVRTPSQPLTHVNGVVGVGPNGLPRPQSSGGRSNSGIAQPMPIQNSQGQPFAAQQAALNARLVQQQQRFQQQYGIQQQPVPSPTSQVQVLGSLQQPVPTKAQTPVYNSRTAPSPSPQIFSNALMHSTSNSSQPGLQNIQSHSRSQSVISISSSSRPNSSASTSRTQMQAPLQTPLPRPPSAVNAAQAGLAGALNQQQVQGQYQGVSPRPQSQDQNGQIEMMQHYQNFQQQRILQQQQAQQQAQQQPPQPQPQQQPPQQPLQLPQQQPQQPPQHPPQQQPSQLAPQQQPSQPHPCPSSPLIPVRPSPETQPPPPSGSIDGSFVSDQAQTSPMGGDMIAETSHTVEEAPLAPMPNANVGASTSTPLATKRGSVVLESSGDRGEQEENADERGRD
ncbi:hypothetical protein FA13DRAFT_565654 [Coprinellus micaceus]|uniref:Uncharacterized protein n=1 Tax=Coprinellus micaceus TaxID=71717 RepID=A0A4Y7T7A7_COPMI|nr:hypothetical protein FA13DRAFT_565654 [Coprinellus micaceus]